MKKTDTPIVYNTYTVKVNNKIQTQLDAEYYNKNNVKSTDTVSNPTGLTLSVKENSKLKCTWTIRDNTTSSKYEYFVDSNFTLKTITKEYTITKDQTIDAAEVYQKDLDPYSIYQFKFHFECTKPSDATESMYYYVFTNNGSSFTSIISYLNTYSINNLNAYQATWYIGGGGYIDTTYKKDNNANIIVEDTNSSFSAPIFWITGFNGSTVIRGKYGDTFPGKLYIQIIYKTSSGWTCKLAKCSPEFEFNNSTSEKLIAVTL